MLFNDDGSFYVTGYTESTEENHLFICKYTAGGTLDTGFSTDGIDTYNAGSYVDACGLDLQFDSSGNITVLGDYSDQDDDNKGILLLKFDTSGTLVNSFGTAGKSALNLGDGYFKGRMIIDSADIYVTGYSFTGGNLIMNIRRFLGNGSFDTTYAIDGLKNQENFLGHSITADSNGYFVVSGAYLNGTDFQNGVLRLNENWNDASFGFNAEYSYQGRTGYYYYGNFFTASDSDMAKDHYLDDSDNLYVLSEKRMNSTEDEEGAFGVVVTKLNL